MKKFKLYRAISKCIRLLFVNKKNRGLLKNKDFTILSNNCVGSLISHDLNQKFLTPTVNLFMGTEDFMKFISNLDYYLELKVVEKKLNNENYPVGLLGDISIHFMHYKNIDDAIKKWDIRKKRINKENLFILMVDNDDCSYETIEKFKELSFESKIFLTNKLINKNENFIKHIKGFEKYNYLGDLTMYQNILGKKYYDQFNYVDWLNRK